MFWRARKGTCDSFYHLGVRSLVWGYPASLGGVRSSVGKEGLFFLLKLRTNFLASVSRPALLAS